MTNIYRGLSLSILFGLFSFATHSQSTCGADITLTSQAEVDAFPSRGCASVGGNFTIAGADIIRLDPLTLLTSVEGRLMIAGNSALVSLHGLENLTSVGVWSVATESLIIENNDVLTSLEALRGITTVPGTLRIQNNSRLTDLDGLNNITKVGPGRNVFLDISSNEKLESLNGLSSLELVTSDYTTTVRIGNNPMLRGIDGLGALKNVVGGFGALVEITDNASINHVDSLSSLLRIDAANPALRVRNNPQLTRGCGLYTLLANNGVDACPDPQYECGEITFANNGAEFTKESIVAGGPCSGQAQPTNLVFTDVAATSMKISFTAATPTPVSYLVLLKANQSPYPTHQPVDGTSYSVGQLLSSSTIVVGTGNKTTFNISSMSPGTTYYFNVYSVYAGNDYVNTTPLTASQATINALQPTNMSFADVSTNGMKLSFNPPSPAPVGYITLMRPNNYPTDVPTDGQNYAVGNVLPNYSIVVGMGSATTLNLVSMDPNTEYFFSTYSYTSSGSAKDYVNNNPLQGHQRTNPSAALIVAAKVPFPNPFSTTLSIPVSINERSRSVIVSIYNSMGEPVAEFTEEYDPGEHEVVWDGMNYNHEQVGRGNYVYRVKVEGTDVVVGRIAKE